MQIDQPIPPVGGQNPYDFILSGPPKPKRSILPTGGSSKQRTMVVAAGAGALLFFFIIIALLLSNGGGSYDGLTKVAQTQTELQRVSNLGYNHMRDAPSDNFVQNVYLTMLSGQQTTVSYLASHGVKLKSKNLAMLQNSKSDKLLESAQQNGDYDSVMVEILSTQLKSYRSELATDYKNTNSKSQKALLKQFYDDANGLLTNLPQPTE